MDPRPFSQRIESKITAAEKAERAGAAISQEQSRRDQVHETERKANLALARESMKRCRIEAAKFLLEKGFSTEIAQITLPASGRLRANPVTATFPEGWAIWKIDAGPTQVLTPDGRLFEVIQSDESFPELGHINNFRREAGRIVQLAVNTYNDYAIGDNGPYLAYIDRRSRGSDGGLPPPPVNLEDAFMNRITTYVRENS